MEKTSSRFNSSDTDVICRSSDLVNFKLHRRNLEMHSNIIAMHISNNPKQPQEDEDVTQPQNNPLLIPMTESSSVLELLFQFMHNQPQPDLLNLTFSSLTSLTAAVEKYQVYAASESCRARLRECVEQYPLRVLNIATNYKYTSLMDEAAAHTIGLPLKDIQSTLKPHVFNAWIRYHRSWMDLLNEVYTYQEPTRWHWEGLKDKVGVKAMDSPCEVWTEIWAKVAYRFAGKPENLLQANEIFQQTKEAIGLRCMSCPKWIMDWHKEVTYRMGKLPKFSTYL